MPHITLEYSHNLEKRADLEAVARRVHEAALATGVLPEKGLRTRMERREVYHIADGHPDNAFVHVVVRLGHGRDQETRRRVGEAVFSALADALAEDQATNPLALSCEVQEIHPDLSWKRNNLLEWISKRTEG